MSRRDEIRERVEGATPGPWEWVAEGPGEGNITLRTTGRGYDDHILTPHVCEACEKRGARCLAPTAENAAFIAAAREDVPFLLGEVERLRGAVLHQATRRHEFNPSCDACVEAGQIARSALGEPE